jgi:monofunctional biosynthetic peptidoglycan transglycosylase
MPAVRPQPARGGTIFFSPGGIAVGEGKGAPPAHCAYSVRKTGVDNSAQFAPSQKYQILRIARNLLLIVLAVLLLPYLLAPLYRGGHPVSTLMAWRWLTGAPVLRHWIDFSAISPALPRAVVGAEDAQFCSHHGIDWHALREVIDDAEEDGEVTRGGSTITQQVAKNLFLWPGRSVIRKALELPLALWIDLVLPKQRILEIYLNIAELGPSGQFGAEAGAIYAFSRPASSLSPREAALLAAILPNPHQRSARNPGPGVRRLAGTYMARAQAPELQRCWHDNRAF